MTANGFPLPACREGKGGDGAEKEADNHHFGTRCLVCAASNRAL